MRALTFTLAAGVQKKLPVVNDLWYCELQCLFQNSVSIYSWNRRRVQPQIERARSRCARIFSRHHLPRKHSWRTKSPTREREHGVNVKFKRDDVMQICAKTPRTPLSTPAIFQSRETISWSVFREINNIIQVRVSLSALTTDRKKNRFLELCSPVWLWKKVPVLHGLFRVGLSY
jgi:hypothetical protein